MRTRLAYGLSIPLAALLMFSASAAHADSPTGSSTGTGALVSDGVIVDGGTGDALPGSKAQDIAATSQLITNENATVSPDSADSVTYKDLSITGQQQQKSEWCVPASSRATLTAFVSSPPSQTALAKAESTSDTKGTNLRNVPLALNQYQSKNHFVFYTGINSASSLFSTTRTNVVTYKAPLIPALQASYLPLDSSLGYSGNHAVTLYGYGSNNTSIHYLDPDYSDQLYGRHVASSTNIWKGMAALGTPSIVF